MTVGIALFGILAAALGSLLYGPPRGPDALLGESARAGTFLLSFAVVAAQFSWGYVLAKRAPLWERYLWGASFTLAAVATLGFLPGAIGANSAPVWRLFLFSGCAAALFLHRRHPEPWPWPRIQLADFAACLVFGLGILGAAEPHSFWDSLWYHLPAGRLWFEAGRIYLPTSLPIIFQCGFWDYQFLLGQILLGGPDGGGLIAAQLFGQWISLASFAVVFLLLRTQSGRWGISAAGAFLAIVGTELFIAGEFVKNDGAVVLWQLGALALLLDRRPRAAALVAGMALATKLSAAFFLIPWGFFFLKEFRRDAKVLAHSAALAALGFAPIFVRNAVFTGNPFFPALARWFPSKLQGPSWNGINAYTSLFPGPAGWLQKFFWLAQDNKAVLCLFALPWAWRKIPRTPLACALATLALLFFGLGSATEWRFAGAGLVLAAAYGTTALEQALQRIGKARTPLLLAGGLFLFPIDWRAPTRVALDPSLRAREGVSGQAMAWVRLHAAPGTAMTLNETRIYYLFPGFPRRAFDDPDLDRQLALARAPQDLPALFASVGVRYLVLSAEFIDLAYGRQVCDWAYLLSEQHPEAVVFRASLSRVLDLSKL